MPIKKKNFYYKLKIINNLKFIDMMKKQKSNPTEKIKGGVKKLFIYINQIIIVYKYF